MSILLRLREILRNQESLKPWYHYRNQFLWVTYFAPVDGATCTHVGWALACRRLLFGVSIVAGRRDVIGASFPNARATRHAPCPPNAGRGNEELFFDASVEHPRGSLKTHCTKRN